MKNIGIFYLIFVVLLSAFPCNDELEKDDFAQNAVINKSNGVDQAQTENCSPICACTCCGQSIIEIDIAGVELKYPINLLAKQAPNSQFSLQQHNKNIWHPPKVV